MSRTFHGKAAVQQRVLPFYRAPFFDLLAESCSGGLDVFAGNPRRDESIELFQKLFFARYQHAENVHVFGGSFYLCWQRNLLDWIRAVQPDVLILEANPRYPASSAAIRWMHRHGKPVVGWGLGAPDLKGFNALLRESSRRNFLLSFDAMIAYSDSGAEEYRRLGIAPDRVFVAPNAVTSAPMDPPVSREAPKVKANLLFVGRLQQRKRLDMLMYACASLPESIQPRLTIVGDGPDRKRLENIAAEIYPDTIFTGTLIGDLLTPYFVNADLFVLPGTGGLAIQQAMSYALPVIVAEGDGTQSNLVRSSNGWHIIPGDLEDLKSVLKNALCNGEKLPQMGMESYRIVREEINLEKMVDVFLEAIHTVSHL